MPGRTTHVVAGVSAGIMVYGVVKYIKQEEWTLRGAICSATLGALGGMLPDMLEPATNPNHRQFFHSLLFGAVLFFGRDKLYEILGLNVQQKALCNSLLAGYSSHLVLDGITPKSLPLA